MTEFFADFGTYDVKVTLPKNYVIGATGVQVADTDNGNGTKTVAFHAEDVHDFAWTADPNFKVIESTIRRQRGAGKDPACSVTTVTSVSGSRTSTASNDSMKRFDDWYGPYPYAQLTVVDPPHGAGEAGGMEYPTFITGDSGWFIPKGVHLIDLVTEHEFGHQYWYGMVATNEFENGWLDEGINSYTEVKVLDNFYGPDASVINLTGRQLGEREIQRMGYLGATDIDPLSKFSYQDMSSRRLRRHHVRQDGDHADHAGEDRRRADAAEGTAHLLHALPLPAPHAGRLHAHGERSRRTGPELVLEAGGLRDAGLGLRGEARRLRSGRRGGTTNLKEKKGETEYETQVILHRKGDFVFPVEAVVKFDNGESTIERWDGKDRWVRYVYRKKAQVESVHIDPDYQVTHGSRLPQQQPGNGIATRRDCTRSPPTGCSSRNSWRRC